MFTYAIGGFSSVFKNHSTRDKICVQYIDCVICDTHKHNKFKYVREIQPSYIIIVFRLENKST